MKYHFTLQKNIHMYNHIIVCSFGDKKHTAICESAPTKEETILFWPDDFSLPIDQTNEIIKELKLWAKTQGFRCIIKSGNRIK